MFRKITKVDELIRGVIRPKPIVSVLNDVTDEEDLGVQKPSHLGATTRFKGDISLEENLCIEGEIEGTITIRGKQLGISAKALVKGEVRARTVEVRGTVEGDIHGDDLVHLHATAVITGNVCSKRIVVDDGARFDGHLRTTREVVKAVEVKKATKLTLKEVGKSDDNKPADSAPTLHSVSS